MLGKMLLVGGNTWRLSQYVKSDQVNGVEDYGGIAGELKLGPELFDCVRTITNTQIKLSMSNTKSYFDFLGFADFSCCSGKSRFLVISRRNVQ